MRREPSGRAENPARDEEDARLIEAEEHGQLLAVYYPIILVRLRVRQLPQPEAEEVRQRVIERLLTELRAAKRYDVPFRVVVHQRTTWELLDYFKEQKRRTAELSDDQVEQEVAAPFARIEDDMDFTRLVADLPPRERQVVELRWGRGLEVSTIAELVGINANAVHQALHRAHRKLRQKIG